MANRSRRGAHSSPPDRQARRLGLLVLCLSLLAYGYFIYRGPHHNPDSRLALTYSVVERGALDIDPYAAMTLDRAYAGGHFYTDKAPGVSFFLVPLYALFHAILPPNLIDLGTLAEPDRFVVRYLLTFFGIGVPAALFNTAFFAWLRHLEPRAAPRLLVTLGYAFGSPAYPFGVSAFGHVPAAMALATALMCLWPFEARRSTPRTVAAGLLLGLAVMLEYPAGLGSAILAAVAVWRTPERRRNMLELAAGAALPLTVLAAYLWAAFGSPLSVGYAHLAPGTEYVAAQATGLLGVGWPSPRIAVALLAGAHRGLFIFAPWLTLALPGPVLLWRRRETRTLMVACVGVFSAMLLVNSGYAIWDGGASWGPRHVVPALPFLAILTLPAARRWPRLGVILAAVSIAMTLAGVATGSLPDSEVRAPLVDLVWPRVLAGGVTNNWGELAGLAAWRGLVPAAAVCALVAGWAAGWRRSAGLLVLAAWSLGSVALLNRAYQEYSEGYYLYLGSRVAAGARLYFDTASTQPPLLPLVVVGLWQLQPDVWLPRLFAIGCYAVTAMLTGRLAARLLPDWWAGPAATALAALLPLGAGAAQVLDANAVLAPLAVGLALLWTPGGGASRESWWTTRRVVLAALIGAAGVSTKLTFLPFAVVPLLGWIAHGSSRSGARRASLTYGAALVVAVAAEALVGWRIAGAASGDALFGEAESPAHVAGALLATLQFLYLEGPALLLAIGGWWATQFRGASCDTVSCNSSGLVRLSQHGTRDNRRIARWPDSIAWFGVAAASLPLFAVHQGTFVGVARPAEPFIAVFAVVGLATLARWVGSGQWVTLATRAPVRERGVARRGASPRPTAARLRLALVAGRAVVVTPAVLALCWAGGMSVPKLLDRGIVDPDGVIARLQEATTPDEPVLAPPYYAALAGRRMLFDYADWTVLGMRAAAGVPREAAPAADLTARLKERALPLVAADFRLDYIAPVAAELRRSYVATGSDGDDRARSVTFWVPK